MKLKVHLFALLCFCVTICNAQINEASLLQQNEIDTEEFKAPSLSQVKNPKEYSLGVFFMPIPLNIESITTFSDGRETVLANSDNLFNTGIGASINADFNKSGYGFGAMGYLAVIGGDDLRAIDSFFAFKYDIPLGDKADTNFEISPLIGIGNLIFELKDNGAGDPAALGNSLYASGGARVTWLVANNLFFGADIITVPFLFNTEKLLGLENDETIDEASIKYKFIFQANISLRYNLF